MATSVERKQAIKGGEFLIRETPAQEIFIPEEFSEEQKMVEQQCKDFLDKEVFPHLDEIDSMKDPKMMPRLLDKAGELGLLGTSIPEEYGGFGMDFNTTMLVAEVIGAGHSVAVALSAHTGIGTLPILYYGTEAQKKKYLPKLATGEWKAAYCLTEPDSGSDANSGKTKATPSPDGKHYLINGLKTSLQLATLTALAATALGLSAAVALDRLPARQGQLLMSLFLSPLIVPGVVVGFALLIFYARTGVDDTFLRLLGGHVLITFPYAVRTVLAALGGIRPSLVEVAQSLGASPTKAFWTVTFPLTLPGIAAGVIVVASSS